jgi:hypothetical protein
VATRKTSKTSALKHTPKTPKTPTNPELGISQVNTDLAVAAQCEAEDVISIEDHNFLALFYSPEYKKLEQTYRKEAKKGGAADALLKAVWRGYNAGLLSPPCSKVPGTTWEIKLLPVKK